MTSADKRAALLKARRAQQEERGNPTPAASPDATRAHFTGASMVEALTEGRKIQSLPVALIAPELRPELRQPRLLPLPEELQPNGEWNKQEQVLIDELLRLGASIREQQIHPIVVYPGTSTRYPDAQYLIAVGHRRWTAARLVGLPTIEAIVVACPNPQDLLAIQFRENEERAEFCDMERAWAIERMRKLLSTSSWEAVEARFRISDSRRKQLLRLTAFTPEQQRTVARIRASEYQLRPLHTAVRAKLLLPEQVDRILNEVAVVEPTALEHAVVERLVSRTLKTNEGASASSPDWLLPLRRRLRQTIGEVGLMVPKVQGLEESERIELRQDVEALLASLEQMVAALASKKRARR
jgi:ParB/RepB/Spo0J family partition protein